VSAWESTHATREVPAAAGKANKHTRLSTTNSVAAAPGNILPEMERIRSARLDANGPERMDLKKRPPKSIKATPGRSSTSRAIESTERIG
jgi:hypothetical protein